tara:strand:+ start:1008 stop:1223 length:216 start_codon:yes stop_codon:yes gene_type:complete
MVAPALKSTWLLHTFAGARFLDVLPSQSHRTEKNRKDWSALVAADNGHMLKTDALTAYALVGQTNKTKNPH